MIRAGFTYVVVIIATVVMASLAIITSFLDTRGRLFRRFAKIWAWCILAAAGIRREVTGLEHIDPELSYVVVSNHQSLLDIPVLFLSLPMSVVMAAKKELFRIPIFGWAMALAKFPRIDRQNPEHAREALRHSSERLKGMRVSVVVFPEGTRSPDGEVKTFKRGAFFLARDLAFPMLPVSIAGTHELTPKHSFRIRTGKVHVRVRPAIEEEAVVSGDRMRVMDTLRNRVLAGLAGSAPSET